MIKTFDTYQREASATFKEHQPLSAEQAMLLDWSMGLSGETGEFCEVLKHHIFHGEPLDKMRAAKELGDILWYASALAKTMDIALEDCAELNIAKLRHRHGAKFTVASSAKRHASEARFEDTNIYLVLKERILGGSQDVTTES